MIRLQTDNVNLKFKIIKDGKYVDIAAEAICPKIKDSLCDIFIRIDLKPLSVAVLLIEDSDKSLEIYELKHDQTLKSEKWKVESLT